MASITSPEQGAQQECSSTFFSPPGGVRIGRSRSLSGGPIVQPAQPGNWAAAGDLLALHQHLRGWPTHPGRVAGRRQVDRPWPGHLLRNLAWYSPGWPATGPADRELAMARADDDLPASLRRDLDLAAGFTGGRPDDGQLASWPDLGAGQLSWSTMASRSLDGT